MTGIRPKILRYESLPSTNTEVARLAAQGAEEGLAIVADEQTAGRGRLQRVWVSPKGAGLYFSLLLRPKIPTEQWPLITFAAAVAVGDALLEACKVETDIKWPNDLLAGERKICGILAEVVDGGVVVGIGINLTREAYPSELNEAAVSVAEFTGVQPDRETVLAALIRGLQRWYALLNEPGGAEKLIATWESRSTYVSGKTVRVVNGDEILEGTTRGLERDGALRLETKNSELRIIRAGDVVSLRRSL